MINKLCVPCGRIWRQFHPCVLSILILPSIADLGLVVSAPMRPPDKNTLSILFCFVFICTVATYLFGTVWVGICFCGMLDSLYCKFRAMNFLLHSVHFINFPLFSAGTLKLLLQWIQTAVNSFIIKHHLLTLLKSPPANWRLEVDIPSAGWREVFDWKVLRPGSYFPTFQS